MDKRNTSSDTYENIVKAIHLQYSRGDTKLPTRTVPHGPLSEIAHSTSGMESGSTGSAGFPKSPQIEEGQPLQASTASAQNNNGAADDADESTLLLGEDL